MRNTSTNTSWFPALAMVHVLAVLVLPGCGDSGPGLHAVAGKVTFQGRPVEQGIVRFCNPEAGIDMTAALGQDGVYGIVTARGKGLPEGAYRVAMMPPRVDLPVGPLTQPLTPPKRDDIPNKYHELTTSGLTATVASGNKSYDFDLVP